MSGDYAALAGLQGKIAQLANGTAQAQLVKVIAAEAITQAQLSFRESRDPYGTAWAPLKHREGKPLLLTGRLRSSIAVQMSGPTAFRIGTNVHYALFHQQGVDKVFTRKARSQVAIRRTSGKGAGRFEKLRGRKSIPRRAEVIHFAERSMHLVIPRRAFFPDAERLGPIWSKAFVDAGNAALLRILGGK